MKLGSFVNAILDASNPYIRKMNLAKKRFEVILKLSSYIYGHEKGIKDSAYIKYNNSHNFYGSTFCNYSLAPLVGNMNLITVPSFDDLSIQIIPP